MYVLYEFTVSDRFGWSAERVWEAALQSAEVEAEFAFAMGDEWPEWRLMPGGTETAGGCTRYHFAVVRWRPTST